MSPSASSAATVVIEPRPAAAADTATGKLGMWLFLVTDGMGFAGLLIAYAVLRVRATVWPDSEDRLVLAQVAFMTAALLTSSFTMTRALVAARTHRAVARTVWLLLTLGLGVAFLGGQALEYRHLLEGARPMRLGSDAFASTFYALTGYHGLHVAVGVVLLLGLLVGRVSRPRVWEVVGLFWHFVDLAWIPILSLVYLLPST
jgi:heme/copper-type cytochrome/quinol oxidase subunit 3